MRILVDSIITVLEPSADLLRLVKDKLTITNPMFIKMLKMGKRTYGIDEKIKFYWWDGSKLCLPRGLIGQILKTFPNEEYIYSYNLRNTVNFKSDIFLRDYQEPAVDKAKYYKQGIIVMPCGSGKTETALHAIANIGQPTLWITHTKDLLNQSKDRAINKLRLYGDEIGVIGGGRWDIGTHITFATVQSLANKDLNEIKYRFGCIVIDECHKTFLSSSKAAQFSKVISTFPALYRIGITASEHRSDGLIKSMYYTIGPKIYEVPQDNEMLKTNVMVPDVKFVTTDYIYGGLEQDYSQMLVDLANDEERNTQILDTIKNDVDNRYTIVLSDRLSQLKWLYDRLNENNIPCGYIDGSTPKMQRERILKQAHSGELKVLFATYKLAKEGLDIPCLDRLILATPQRDKVTIQQSVGRVMRKAEGKNTPIVYDFIDKNIGVFMGQFASRFRVYKDLGCIVTKPRFEDYNIKILGGNKACNE